MSLCIHIERIILNGVPLSSDESALLQSSIVSELSELFADNWQGATATSRCEHRIVAQPIQVGRPHDDAESVGKQIAGSIFESFHQ